MEGNRSQSSGAGSEFGLIVFLFAMVILVVGAWLMMGNVISSIVLFIRKMEAYPISWVSNRFAAIVDWIGLAQRMGGKQEVGALWRLSWDVLRPWSVIVGGLLLWGAFRTFTKHPLMKLRKKHSIESLREAIAKNMPWTNPTAKLDLVNKDTRGWEYQLSPGEFAIKHGLLTDYYTHREDDTEDEALMTDEVRVSQLGAWADSGKFNRAKSRQLFIAQLGPKWTGLERLQAHEKALFGVFAAQVVAKNKLALAALDAIARTYPAPDFSKAHVLAEQLIKKNTVQRVLAKHQYVRTVLLGMIDAAHKNGKLTTSLFIWLKPTDRTLFYALNSLPPPGQMVAVSVEAAGTMSHYFAEKMAAAENIKLERLNKIGESREPNFKARPMYVVDEPYVDQAVVGFHEALMMTGEARDDDDDAAETRALLASRMNVSRVMS